LTRTPIEVRHNEAASRFEANIAHTFGDFSSNELGILAGLSFFTR